MTPGGIFSRIVALLGGAAGLRRRGKDEYQAELHQLDHPADSQVDAVRFGADEEEVAA